MGPTVAAGLAAAAVAGLVFASLDAPETRLRGRLGARGARRSERPGLAGRGRGWWGGAGLAAMVAVAWRLGGGPAATLALVAGIGAATGLALTGRARARRAAEADAAGVVRAAEALAGALHAGAIPATALAGLADEQPLLAEAAIAQGLGGDVADALRRCARGAGRTGLAELATAWEVAARTGASLEATVAAMAHELARRREVAEAVRVELAAARAAGRVLALLPAAGVVLGYGLGGDPPAFLLGQPAGWVCLVVAAALAAAGLLWTDRLAARVRR